MVCPQAFGGESALGAPRWRVLRTAIVAAVKGAEIVEFRSGHRPADVGAGFRRPRPGP